MTLNRNRRHCGEPRRQMIEPVALSAQDPIAARSLVGLAGRPTIVALGPFDDREHADQLALAFTAVRRRCNAQLVLLGTGTLRAAVLRRTFAHGVGASVHTVRYHSAELRMDFIAAADLVVPSPTSGLTVLMDVLAAGRPLVAQANPVTGRLLVLSSAGLIYRPGDVLGMAAALLRLLTSRGLRHRMAAHAAEVARRHRQQRIALRRSDEGTEYA
jgi:glycosyltransferase involved in cell wall biosynthesis